MFFLDFSVEDRCRIGLFYVVENYKSAFLSDSSDKCSMYDVITIVLRKIPIEKLLKLIER